MEPNHELAARPQRAQRFTRSAARLALAAAGVSALAVCVRLVFPAAARSEWLGEVVLTEAPCLVLAAASVIGLRSRSEAVRRLAQAGAWAVLAIGAAALLGAARGTELLSLPCAAGLVLIGAAVPLATGRGSRRAAAAEVMACIAMATGMLAQLGHLYRVEDLYRLGRAPFEPWSALALGLLGAAVLMARPGFALSRAVAGRMLGDLYLRRALPALLGLPIAAGMLGALGAHAGWWSESAAFAVSTVVATAGLGVVGSVHARRLDVLAREQRRLEALFRRTFENAAVGIGHLDTQLRWLRANDRLCEILGRPREELLGSPALEGTDEADRAAARAAYVAVAQGGAESRRFEQRAAAPAGGELWTDVVLSAARDGEGDPAYLIAVVQDVTAHKRALAEVAAARAEAERAGRAKDDFFALISHELRSPLSAITNWIAVLRREAPPDVRGRALIVLQRNVALLTRLIGDLLDASRIASGKLEIERAALDLGEVVRAAVAALEPAARERGVILRFTGALSATVLGDGERMEQVVRNLIENALKFTPAGGTVEVQLERTGDQHQIVVRDEGEGIGPELLPHVFERFRQASGGSRGAARGLGLGLSIVRHLVELHGGEVGAASDGAGRGSAFTVRIPAAHGDAAGREGLPDTPADALEGLCVLLLEADRAIAEALAIALEDADAEVAWVQTAAEALAQRDVLKPQVVVADLDQMLTEAALLIRELHALRDEGRLAASVALSTDGSLESRRVARDAGFDAYLVRPVEPAKLIALIASLAAQPDRICVVDDDAACADSLALLLTRCGFEVERAYDAPSALTILERFRADVVVTDLGLGSASGAALAHALRERHGQRLRIVAATGRTPEEIGPDAALFDAFVRKPVDLDALLAAVRGG